LQNLLFLINRLGWINGGERGIQADYSVVNEPGLLEALITLFRGRCPFCESPLQDPLVYRFRPAANAKPISDTSTSHLYYAWLAEAWQNLYPICKDCLPRRDSYFPVNGKRCPLPNLRDIENFVDRDDGRWPDYPLDERFLLLDPCQDRQVWRSIDFLINGRAIAKSRRGTETIQHFDLNRESLVESRQIAIMNAITSTRHDLGVGQPRGLTWIENAEGHEGAVALVLRKAFGLALGTSLTGDLEKQRVKLGRLDDAVEAFDRSVERLQEWREREAPLAWEPPQEAEPDTIAAISITNFKSLERIQFEMPKPPEKAAEYAHAPAMLILGENATGKSTILEAIALAVMQPSARERLKYDVSKAVLNPRYLGGTELTRPPYALIEPTFSGGAKRSIRLVAGSTIIGGDIMDDGYIPHLPLFAYGAFRQYLDIERKFAPHKHVRSLFQPNELLSNPEKWLSGLNESQFNMVVRALREVFSIEGSFDVIERNRDGIFVVSQQHDNAPDKVRREPISIVSSGFRAVLALLCDIMQGLMDKRINPSFESLETARGLVLIDEVEAHLHPRWKMSIMTGLRRALPGVSFIATSHDPLCLRGMAKDEVLVLERVPGEAADSNLPVFTQTLTNLPDNENWTIEQLLTAEFFQLRTTESNEAEKRAARIEDKLAQGLSSSDDPEIAEYLAELSRDLPIGHTEVHRLVHDAIEKYLRLKRNATKGKLARLKAETRNSILNALKSVG
jgi:hypothetical protein